MLTTTEPNVIIAGDTLTWRKSLADYPAPVWSLSYKLVGNTTYVISTTASGSDHVATAPAVDTDLYEPGTYVLQGRVTDGTFVKTLPLKAVTVFVAGFKSAAQKTLDLLDAALESQGSNAWVQSYSISGRTMTFRSAEEFIAFRLKIKAEVMQEDRALRLKMGLKARNSISVRL